MSKLAETYLKKEFWAKENLNYVEPHFRLQKAARLVNKIAGGKECDLLDLGCGPAALKPLTASNIRYHGIDIAIQQPAPYLLEADFVEAPINFAGKHFDIILAQGVFEYMGGHQAKKLEEIHGLLKDGGKFVVSYVNFDHRNKHIYWPYNNIQSFDTFLNSLARVFRVERYFPTSHRWYHDEPRSRAMKAIQKHINVNLPLISRHFAVEYFFICSK